MSGREPPSNPTDNNHFAKSERDSEDWWAEWEFNWDEADWAVETLLNSVSQNQSDIAANESDITQNSTDIASNAASINTLETELLPNTDTFHIDSGSSEEWFKIARIDSGGGFNDTQILVDLISNGPQSGPPCHTKIYINGRAASGPLNYEWAQYGEQSNIRGEVVVTRDIDNHMYLYVRAPSWVTTPVRVRFSKEPANWDFGQVAAEDVIGDIEYDMSNEDPSMYVDFGTLFEAGDRVATRTWTQTWAGENTVPKSGGTFDGSVNVDGNLTERDSRVALQGWVSTQLNNSVGDKLTVNLATGSSAEFVKLSSLKDKTEGSNGGGFARYRVNFAGGRGSQPTREIDLIASAKGSTLNAYHKEAGAISDAPFEFVVTEDPGDGTPTDAQYNVYLYIPEWAATTVEIVPSRWYGDHDVQTGLQETDLVGTIKYDTRDVEPDMPFRAGSISLNGGRAITGSAGNSGEWMPLQTQRDPSTHTTTSTTLVNAMGGTGRVRVNFENMLNISGFDSLGVDFAASFSVPDTETLEANIFAFSGVGSGVISSISLDGPRNFSESASPIGEFNPPPGTSNLEVRFRSVGGQEVTMRTPTVTVYGRLS